MKHDSAENIQSAERIEVGADIQTVFHCVRVFPTESGLTKRQGESFKMRKQMTSINRKMMRSSTLSETTWRSIDWQRARREVRRLQRRKTKMKQKLFSGILSIFILIAISCDKNESTISDEMKFPIQLTSSGKDFVGFWSPDGKYIAFLSARNTYDPYTAAIITELWIMKSDGSDENPIISLNDLAGGNISMSWGISWSKDSQYMLVPIQNFDRRTQDVFQQLD